MGRRGAALALLFVRVLLRLLSARSAARRRAWRRIDPASASRAAAEGGLAAASALAALAVLRREIERSSLFVLRESYV